MLLPSRPGSEKRRTWTTNNKIPPPGASRRTFRKPIETYLGCKTFVQGTRPLFAEDEQHPRKGAGVLGRDARDAVCVLDAGLDHVRRRVEHGADKAANRARDEAVAHRLAAVVRFREQLLDFKDGCKVAAVPQDVADHSAAETIIETGPAALLDNRAHHVHRAAVQMRLALVLQPDFHKLKWHDDQRLGRARKAARQQREALRLFLSLEKVAEGLSPEIVGAKLDRALRRLEQEQRRNAAVQPAGPGSAGRRTLHGARFEGACP